MKLISAKTCTSIVVSIFTILISYCQDTNIFKQINTQVWEKFEEAFQTNNVDLINSIHTKDILRIPADKQVIISGEDYFDSQLKSFNWVKENNYYTKIELRFIERIANNNYGSERGIYKFTVTDPGSEERIFYGKFHVLLRKVDENWKIMLDYDSNENNTINEEIFRKAFDKWNFKPFLMKKNRDNL